MTDTKSPQMRKNIIRWRTAKKKGLRTNKTNWKQILNYEKAEQNLCFHKFQKSASCKTSSPLIKAWNQRCEKISRRNGKMLQVVLAKKHW